MCRKYQAPELYLCLNMIPNFVFTIKPAQKYKLILLIFSLTNYGTMENYNCTFFVYTNANW